MREPKKQDICYATQNRQDAVKFMSPQVDVVIVVGSPTSSNSNRLREVARKLGAESYMVDSADELQPRSGLMVVARVGLTAGASAPDVLVQQVDRNACKARLAHSRYARSTASRKPPSFHCQKVFAWMLR